MAHSDLKSASRRRGPLRARLLAAASILLERVWPTLASLAALAALFLTFAWFGLFAAASFVPRLGILALFALAALFVLWRARGVRLPCEVEIARRIESESDLRHQPLQAQSDRAAGDDPFALALWQEHQRRMREHLSRLRGGTPRTRTYLLDPLGLRAVLAAFLVTAFAYSFGPGGGRVADALMGGEVPLVVAARVDAWATPPGYTGRAPIFLTGETGESTAALDVPEGTILSLRLSDAQGTRVVFTPGEGEAQTLVPLDPASDTGGVPAGGAGAGERGAAAQYELPLDESGTVRVETSLRTLRDWRFAVLPDHPPIVRFDGEPQPGRANTLDIAFSVTDDYGAAEGKALLAVREPVAPGARPLVPVPDVTLAMPRRTAGEAKGRSSLDLTESPYAGARVALTLQVRDDAGQVGESVPLEITLPERRFHDPLARAVIEQRRILALDANAARRVVDMLDAVTLRGEEFIGNAAHYLALRAVRERIGNAEGDETLLSAVDFMWAIALGIEDGGLSVAERQLRDAQENLAEALRNNAGEEEIARLTQELREAMQQYLQAMAEAMRNMPPQMQSQMGEMQEIRPQDLDRMLDRIEDLARSGSRDAAQQLLSELNQMMQSLQAMRPGQQQQGQQGQSPMQEQMNQLGEMLQRQQRLMDETFELGRQQMRRDMESDRGFAESQEGQEGQEGGQPPPGGGQPPMTPEDLRAMQERLQSEQGRLQQDLEALQEAMREQGLQPSQDFGQAGESMGRAEGAIGEGDDGEAVGQQGDAMAALRRGAQDAMQQMQQAMGQGQGQGEGQQPGQGQQQGQGQGQMGPGYGPGRQRSGLDPLGRERQTQGPDFGQDVGVPDEIDIQRARRILDQIRDRLGRQLSPQEERDYLERLLQTP